jgi:hypothetical protein
VVQNKTHDVAVPGQCLGLTKHRYAVEFFELFEFSFLLDGRMIRGNDRARRRGCTEKVK